MAPPRSLHHAETREKSWSLIRVSAGPLPFLVQFINRCVSHPTLLMRHRSSSLFLAVTKSNNSRNHDHVSRTSLHIGKMNSGPFVSHVHGLTRIQDLAEKLAAMEKKLADLERKYSGAPLTKDALAMKDKANEKETDGNSAATSKVILQPWLRLGPF